MKLISFQKGDSRSFGAVEGDEVVDLAGAHASTLREALALNGVPEPAPGAARYALSDVTLLPPIPDPQKILCIGINYDDHRVETGRPKMDFPTIFTRWADTQVAHGAPLIRPRESERFDFEGELAVVIGKGGRRISEADALSHVAGYACYNDGSIRDWQNHTQQFTPGKNFPGTGGFGPWLVTADEIPDPQSLQLTTRLNGHVVQDASTSDMVFGVAKLIVYITQFTALSPGDVISTGTPGGVGARRDPPLWMKAGDVVEVQISGIGTLKNPVAGE